MKVSRFLFGCLIVLGVVEIGGISQLANYPIGDITNNSAVSWLWLLWFFGWWCMLTLACLFMIGWSGQAMMESEEVSTRARLGQAEPTTLHGEVSRPMAP